MPDLYHAKVWRILQLFGMKMPVMPDLHHAEVKRILQLFRVGENTDDGCALNFICEPVKN